MKNTVYRGHYSDMKTQVASCVTLYTALMTVTALKKQSAIPTLETVVALIQSSNSDEMSISNNLLNSV